MDFEKLYYENLENVQKTRGGGEQHYSKYLALKVMTITCH